MTRLLPGLESGLRNAESLGAGKGALDLGLSLVQSGGGARVRGALRAAGNIRKDLTVFAEASASVSAARKDLLKTVEAQALAGLRWRF